MTVGIWAIVNSWTWENRQTYLNVPRGQAIKNKASNKEREVLGINEFTHVGLFLTKINGLNQ